MIVKFYKLILFDLSQMQVNRLVFWDFGGGYLSARGLDYPEVWQGTLGQWPPRFALTGKRRKKANKNDSETDRCNILSSTEKLVCCCLAKADAARLVRGRLRHRQVAAQSPQPRHPAEQRDGRDGRQASLHLSVKSDFFLWNIHTKLAQNLGEPKSCQVSCVSSPSSPGCWGERLLSRGHVESAEE